MKISALPRKRLVVLEVAADIYLAVPTASSRHKAAGNTLKVTDSTTKMPPTPPSTPVSGFTKALNSFKTRLTASERAQFNVSTLDDLKVTILTIQAEQRQRKKMMHMGRIQSFLEAMEQFGKVIEVFVNTADMLAFVWGPLKLLLLVCLDLFTISARLGARILQPRRSCG